MAAARWGALGFWIVLGLSAGCDDGGGGGGGDGGAGDAAADVGPAPDGGDPGADAAPDCMAGTEDCRCLRDGTCRLDGLTCVEGVCRGLTDDCDPTVERCPPANPVCYTPCRGNVLGEDGQVRICGNDGLMEGCLAGSTCHRGSCVPATPMNAIVGEPGTCSVDSDCPDFQTCIVTTSGGGRCYAECRRDTDCEARCAEDPTCDPAAGARVCHRRVCRPTCGSGSPCAASGTACHDGVCLPLARSGEGPAPAAGAAFSVGPALIQFTSSATEGVFTIYNEGDLDLVLTVARLEELEVGADGAERLVTENPLPWLEIEGERGLPVEVPVPAGGASEVRLSGARNPDRARWEGRLGVSAPGLGEKAVRLVYNQEVPGRWVGTAYAFGNFDDGARPLEGRFPLDTWRANRADSAPLDGIANAFLQAWGRYRNGRLGLAEMGALIDTTLTGSWDFPRVRELCRAEGFDARTICAPFGGAGSRSVIPYTTAGAVAVPSGVVELDLALDLRAATAAERDARCGGMAHCFVGRIDSASALQYGGDPEVALAFAGDPAACARSDADAGCIAYLDRLESELAVGGRYPSPNGNCVAQFAAAAVPWLVPGFASPSGSTAEWTECRDTRIAAPGANPIPDGAPRRRRLELVDGLMVEQHVMTLLLRETVDAFHGGDAPLASYLYVVLERAPDAPDPEAARGTRPPAAPAPPVDAAIACDPALVRRVVDGGADITALSRADAEALAYAVVTGTTGGAPADLGAQERVHYLCVHEEDAVRSVVDGALDAHISVVREIVGAGPDGDRPCFPGAEVIWFTTPPDVDPTQWDCNTINPETCLQKLVTEVARGVIPLRLMERSRDRFPDVGANVSFDLIARCDDPRRASCDDDRYDLRRGKSFFRADGTRTFFSPIEGDIAQAFRYKLQFVGRTGSSVGFAPEICRAGANLVPYCYDPAGIEAVRQRADCALALYHGALDGDVDLGPDARASLRDWLTRSFSAIEQDNPYGDPVVSFGFERLYAELLIMLGDDAYTTSFASRFDLAGGGQLAFEGSAFEEGGIDLSGAAGYELFKLYQASQYYELVTDRFYGMSAWLWRSLSAGPGGRYVTAATVTTWLDRVIRASTQHANAQSEIAARYHRLNRADLARRVLERAFTRAHQESLALGAFMDDVMGAVRPDAIDQVRVAITDARRRYRVAMLDMRKRHRELLSRVDVFGLPPELIPFPALDENDLNGFHVMLARAKNRVALAATDEAVAIASRRDFDVDLASFHNELVRLRNSYEARLGEVCGTFLGDDGRTYPAIARHAHRHPDLAGLDDPCGAAGNGELWLAGGNLQGRELELQRVRQEAQNVLASEQDAIEWVAKQCDLIGEDVARFLQEQGAVDQLAAANDRMQSAITQLDKVHDFVGEFTSRVADVADEAKPWSAAVKASQNGVYIASAITNLLATSGLEIAINIAQEESRRLEREYEAYTLRRQCEYLQAEQVYTLRAIHRELVLAEIDILNAIWNVQVEFAAIQAVANERNRLETEWRDAEQLVTDAAAAQSDPNVRIYKNDAILNADRSFDRALREAWKATRTYEYYSASSYAEREQLFLVRTVGAGDYHLRRYLQDLEDAFHRFEQQFGNPDTRVATLSLRDDVVKVPRYAVDGSNRVLTSQERAELLRAALQDPARLDRNGALTFAFSTAFDQLSPLTVNHKILFIEVEVFGRGTGDDVGRVYLRQVGTGVVQGTDGDRRFFTFPPRTAVMNPFFNGKRAFGQDANGAITGPTRSIYRSYRFRERPFVQSRWELVLDQRGEAVNRDIALSGVDDIVVYVYYTDFTRD